MSTTEQVISDQTKHAFLAAYQPIHQSFSKYCHSKCLGLLSHEDIVQEAVITALTSYDKIKDPAKLLGYLIGTANNKISNYKRRLKFKSNKDIDQLSYIEAKVYDPDIALDIEYLYKCIESLPQNQRDCILLFEISGFKIKEIAEIQKAKPQAIKTRLHRARKRLKELMSEDRHSNSLTQTLMAYSMIL